VRLSPAETKENRGMCPKCGKPVTVGVMNRVDCLADRPEGYTPCDAIPFKNLIPLEEIIAGAKGIKSASAAIERDYRSYIARFQTEFDILLKVSPEQLAKGMPKRVVDGIVRMRQKKVSIQPGFDGEYGTVSLFDAETETAQPKGEQQLSLF
jgi:PHP family Zn ribbon phosphoesterase